MTHAQTGLLLHGPQLVLQCSCGRPLLLEMSPGVWQAYTLGFIEEEGLQQVALEAVTALRRARARHAFAKVDWARIIRQLNKDLRAANAILPDQLQITPIAIPSVSSSVTRSTSVSSE